MSHSGKFVSVNLNRSYGQPAPSSHHGGNGGGRPSRPAGAGSSGGGGGGGMVVLSRPRGGASSLAKPQAPKLSVPPPLNLPSLRREHERFDGSAAAAGGGVASAPPRSGGPAAGWTKPAATAPEKPTPGAAAPPGGGGGARPPPSYGFAERAAVVLRGEDFPSLKAAVAPPTPPQPAQRQKDAADGARAVTPEARPGALGMRPQVTASRAAEPLASGGPGGRTSAERVQKPDLGPLPMVRLRYDSDWADDERDTGLSLPERDSRERGFGRTEAMLPGRDLYGAMREPFKKEVFGRDVAAANKEGGQDGLWRSPVSNQHDRERTDGRPYSGGRGSSGQSYRESIAAGGSKDVWSNSKEPPMRAYGQNGVEQYGTTRVGEAASERYGDSSNNWPRLNSFQNNVGSKGQPFSVNKGPLINDPVAKFGREKRLTGSPAKTLVEDSGFDSISAVNLTAIKKKKEAAKPVDFHDPARESFEAELDRILRVQEQERQRVMEEQERAREVARRQEEERERLIREEEERQRLMEEQAKQAAWQAEQERLEAAKRAEELRIAREEERKRIAMEEERRREAAHQKLLELEAKIARRQAESNIGSARAVSDEFIPGDVRDRDLSHSANFGDRNDIDKMNECINTSAALESSSLNRFSETVPRVHTLMDGRSSFIDRENAYYSSRAAFPEQENVHHSPRRDPFAAKRGNFPKKDLNDGFGSVSVRQSSTGRTTESPWALEDFRHEKVPRWDAPREIDRFSKQSDFDNELFNSDRIGDTAWLPSSSHGSLNAQQGDRIFQSPDVNELSSFTRPRYSMRQPRVPPPPIVTSVRSSIGGSAQRINSSFVDGGNGESSGRDDVQIMQGQYGSAYQEASRQHAIRPDHISVNDHQIVDRKSPVLGSQSSLSVSSPPSSPPHVSHDEMDVSGDSPALPTSADGERTVLSDNDHAALSVDADNTSRIAASGVPHLEDDEWSSVNNDDRQKQDEYDEDNDSYQEDEINEADDENIDLDDEFLEGQNTPIELEPVILGFDEGVQVEIPPNSQLELASVRSTERAVGVHLNPGVAEQENVSGSVVHSDPVTEAEKALQALTLDRVDALTEDSNGEPSNSLVTPASSSQLPQASSAGPIFSSASAVVGQNEVPVSLQFGLFTGPPLIPTPVPAIQIGSIQMPIHLHNQFNPSLPHMHPSTAPLYQFGQLRYVRPIAPSVRSLPSQAIHPSHSSIPTQHTLNQNASSVLPELMDGDTNQNIPAQASSSTIINKSAAPTANLPLGMDSSNSQYLNAPANNQMAGVEGFHGQVDRESAEGTTPSGRNQDLSLKRNYRPTSNNVESSQYGLEGRAMGDPKAPGVVSDRRGRRYGYAVKDINTRSAGSFVEPSHKDSRGFQRRARRNVRRTEFRVRVEKNQNETSESFCHGEQDEMTCSNGTRDVPARNTNRRELDMNKASRINEASDQSVSFRSTHNVPYERSHGGSKKSRTGSVPDGDTTSLQAGAVRVVKQQGIEVPVDADGFIEVRSKRQIMSVKREQREKENRSKMRMAKAPRKQHSVPLQSSVGPSVNKRAAPSSGEVTKKVSSGSTIREGRIADYAESSVPLMGDTASMNIIVPPSTNAETHTNCFANQPIQIQTSSDLVTSSPAKLASGLSEDNNKGASISTPFNMVSWDNSQMNQQVMPLTQTQLEEAMRPAKFEQQSGSGFSLESNNALSPTVTTEKVFPSSASPINSLLAGEKIQFGAVTSPTMLPPVSRTVSSGLGAPGSSRPDMKIDRGSPSDNSGPDKANSKELCPNAEDAEAEAEAAASAVAVAAISTDEGSPADATTASAPDTKSFTSKDLSGLTSGGARTGQAGQSSTEEPLTVALPADLSVDTPSMSLWPPIASPQASGPMLSQFHGAQPSHFSCFDMNSMLGGHIFAFGPSDESAGSQGQHPQRSNALPSAPLGAWPQCHSGVDSFYRPPTGYAGPFITPGGIPGVQGPPHMVVYNHFAPVGQFGQMGLGFMGATYIPGDKQPDWKQSQGPPIVGVSQSDPNSQNMVSGQVNAPSVPAAVPHLRPTSIMPIPPPLTMFDIAPFQTSTDIQMQTCWPHMPVPPLHSVPLSVALQQHPVEGTATQQFVHNVPVDKSSANNRFQESSASAGPSDGNKTFPNAASSQYRDELGLVEQPASTSSSSQTVQPSFGQAGVVSNEVPTSAKVMVRATPSKVNPGVAAGVAVSNTNTPQGTSIPSKTHQSSSSSDQQYQHPVNNQDRRTRASQKAGTGNEWQRRSGYQGRNQGSGSDRSSGTGRMKQIYVAKPSATSGHAPSG